MDLVLVEQNLCASERGHFLNYVDCVVRAAQQAGWRCRAVIHAGATTAIRDAVTGLPHFRHRFTGLYPPWFRYLRHAHGLGQRLWFRQVFRAFLTDLRVLPERVPFDPQTVFYFATALPAEAWAICTWLRELPAQHRPRVGIMMRFPVVRPYLGQRWSDWIHHRLFGDAAIFDDPSRLRWLSDSRLLIRQFGRCGGRGFHLLPIPHTPGDAVTPLPALRTPGTPVEARFIGRNDPEKGYLLLPEAFVALAPEMQAGTVRLAVQADPPPASVQIPASPVATATRQLHALGARFLGSSLDQTRYQQALLDADIVLLPYVRDLNDYAGTSGVFAEALALGRVVVVTQGTWMADELQRLGAGAAIPSGDPRALTEAVRTCLTQLPQLGAKALTDAGRWRQEHSPERFLQALEAAFADPSPDPSHR